MTSILVSTEVNTWITDPGDPAAVRRMNADFEREQREVSRG